MFHVKQQVLKTRIIMRFIFFYKVYTIYGVDIINLTQIDARKFFFNDFVAVQYNIRDFMVNTK